MTGSETSETRDRPAINLSFVVGLAISIGAGALVFYVMVIQNGLIDYIESAPSWFVPAWAVAMIVVLIVLVWWVNDKAPGRESND